MNRERGTPKNTGVNKLFEHVDGAKIGARVMSEVLAAEERVDLDGTAKHALVLDTIAHEIDDDLKFRGVAEVIDGPLIRWGLHIAIEAVVAAMNAVKKSRAKHLAVLRDEPPKVAAPAGDKTSSEG